MIRRRAVVALIAFSLVLLVRPIAVLPAAACSCAMPGDPMADAAKEPRTAVFTGVVGVPTPDGVPVGVTRWFKASPPGAVVLLDSRGFEDPMGGACGTNQPPTGSEWIFVAWFNERARFDVNLCSTHADLATPEGQTLLTDAETAFGPAEPIPVITPPPLDPTDPPAPTAPANPAAPTAPANPTEAGDAFADGPTIPLGLVLMAGGAGLLAALGLGLALARRRTGR